MKQTKLLIYKLKQKKMRIIEIKKTEQNNKITIYPNNSFEMQPYTLEHESNIDYANFRETYLVTVYEDGKTFVEKIDVEMLIDNEKEEILNVLKEKKNNTN